MSIQTYIPPVSIDAAWNINMAENIWVANGGWNTPWAINIGSSWLIIWQNNWNGIIKSWFAAKRLDFQNSAWTAKLSIDYDNWRIGIGTTWPWRSITIDEGTVAAAWNWGVQISQNSGANAWTNWYEISLLNSTSNVTWQFRANRSAASAYVGMEINATGRDWIRFQTWTSSATEVARIDATWKMGIWETAPDYKLDVNGSFGITPWIATTITPVDNGDLVIETTSNTQLTFKLKGSDGTVRTWTLTLA